MKELDLLQILDLIAGSSGKFADDQERRRAWESERARLLMREPGKRPAAWWDYESLEPRNPEEPETWQLLRLGVLSDEELEDLEHDIWPRWERQARAASNGDEEVYWRKRRERGIPDTFSPNRKEH
jgi:hypothetical protein